MDEAVAKRMPHERGRRHLMIAVSGIHFAVLIVSAGSAEPTRVAMDGYGLATSVIAPA